MLEFLISPLFMAICIGLKFALPRAKVLIKQPQDDGTDWTSGLVMAPSTTRKILDAMKPLLVSKFTEGATGIISQTLHNWLHTVYDRYHKYLTLERRKLIEQKYCNYNLNTLVEVNKFRVAMFTEMKSDVHMMKHILNSVTGRMYILPSYGDEVFLSEWITIVDVAVEWQSYCQFKNASRGTYKSSIEHHIDDVVLSFRCLLKALTSDIEEVPLETLTPDAIRESRQRPEIPPWQFCQGINIIPVSDGSQIDLAVDIAVEGLLQGDINCCIIRNGYSGSTKSLRPTDRYRLPLHSFSGLDLDGEYLEGAIRYIARLGRSRVPLILTGMSWQAPIIGKMLTRMCDGLRDADELKDEYRHDPAHTYYSLCADCLSGYCNGLASPSRDCGSVLSSVIFISPVLCAKDALIRIRYHNKGRTYEQLEIVLRDRVNMWKSDLGKLMAWTERIESNKRNKEIRQYTCSNCALLIKKIMDLRKPFERDVPLHKYLEECSKDAEINFSNINLPILMIGADDDMVAAFRPEVLRSPLSTTNVGVVVAPRGGHARFEGSLFSTRRWCRDISVAFIMQSISLL